jgi:hypothetical protein
MTKLNQDDDDQILKDGQTLRVPQFMMDSTSTLDKLQQVIMAAQRAASTLHAPGSLATTDADRERRAELYQKRDKRLVDAWRNPPPLEPTQAKTAIVSKTSAERYAARDARLESAWNTP